ncbi:MAG: M1 family aminopeptidase [Polyangiaceae bacterium]
MGYGTVYLSDDYGGPSAHYFEETLAHETSHSWWGVMVGPTDYPTTRWLVEGLATLSQIDYAAQHHAGDMPRGVYLARRYREHRGLLQHQTSPGFPAVAPAGPVELEGLDDTFWAYIRSSAALDTLRVIVGEVAFGDALRRYVTRCSASLCDTADFKQALEDEAGFSLDAEFDAYVHAAEFPTPRISWEQYPRTFQVAVDAEGLSRPLPLVLDLFLEDGSVQHARVVLGAGAPAVVEPGAPVRAVAPSRRHDATVWSRSAQTGDVDYDLEVDGFDLVACARAVGHGVGQIPGGDGVLLSDLDYDPRCDLDDDGDVDGADLDVIASDFGTVGAQP